MSIFTGIQSLFSSATSGTVGSIVGTVTNAANDIFNTEADKEKMAQFTTQLQASIQAELDKHNEAVGSIAEKQAEAVLTDIQNARNMEVQLQQATAGGWLSKNIVPMIAVFVNLVWGFVTGYLLFRVMGIIAANPNVNMTALMGFYAGLTAIETIIVSFYFGSSSGSQKKDDTIATIAKS